MSDQLTEEVLARLEGCLANDPYGTAYVKRDELIALLAAARRDMHQRKPWSVTLCGKDIFTQHKCEVVDVGHADKILMVRCHDLDAAEKRIAELEALLDDVPHHLVYGIEGRCYVDCPRCAWERMKGGAK
jgi:hypothetical protein